VLLLWRVIVGALAMGTDALQPQRRRITIRQAIFIMRRRILHRKDVDDIGRSRRRAARFEKTSSKLRRQALGCGR
jgi:hypothetical protein